jgi:capsular exopolysaccharide synthesis family protein
MSKFTKALEQAEKDRERREAAHAVPPIPRIVELRQSALERDVPVVGDVGQAVAVDRGELDDTLQSLTEIGSVVAERYRALRIIVEEAAAGGPPFVIAISSPGARDGKTVTSINLAGALAQSEDTRVLLVDLDLRRGSVPQKLGIRDRSKVGLVDAIRDPKLSLADIVQVLPQYNLSIIPAGRSGRAPYELLRSSRLAELLDEAKRHYHYVVLDTPPLVPVADCRLIERLADRLIVVVAAARTPRKLLEEALRLLSADKLLGFVFNDAKLDGVGYYDGYEYASSSPAEPSWMSTLGGGRQAR